VPRLHRLDEQLIALWCHSALVKAEQRIRPESFGNTELEPDQDRGVAIATGTRRTRIVHFGGTGDRRPGEPETPVGVWLKADHPDALVL
jgi:hypothetical protein